MSNCTIFFPGDKVTATVQGCRAEGEAVVGS